MPDTLTILTIPIITLPNGKPPSKAHETDAGFDVWVREDAMDLEPDGTWQLGANHIAQIPLGFKAAVPEGWYAQLRCRSGYAKRGMHVLGGVIDAGYRNEWIALVAWYSESGEDRWKFHVLNPICQFTLHRVPTVTWQPVEALPGSARGEGGFGSTST